MNSSQRSAQASASDSSTASPPPRMQAVVPLTSVEHNHTSVRSSANNFNGSRGPSGGGTPLNSPSHRSKKGSPAGTPSHRTRSNNASAFFSPPTKGELMESGISPTTNTATQRSTGGPLGGNGESTAKSPKAAAGNAVSAPEVVRERKGRRASRQGNANWFEGDKTNRPADTELNQDVATVNDGVADQELARREQAERAQRQQEQLAQHISDPPTGFQATLPRLSELDVTNSWDKLLRMIRNEYDMSCLTNCLARELDEDVAWNPEMLLVQLTSDMMDAAELQKENEVYVPVDASDIGQMTGGEVVRKRGEKGAPGQGVSSPAPAAAAAAAGAVGGSPGAAAAAKAPAANGAAKRSAAAPTGNGAASPKGNVSVVGPDASTKQSPSKRKSSVASKAASGAEASPKRDGKPLSTKKSGNRSFFKK